MKFIDYKEAIGILVVAGFTVSLKRTGPGQLIIANGEIVTVALFRDGTIFKVKQEAIEDWIEDFNRRENEKVEQEAQWEGSPEWTMNF